jgi:hypothetical protein
LLGFPNEKDPNMLKTKTSRLMAALGGAFILASPATPALAATHFRAVLNGDNELAAADTDGWGRVRIDIDHGTNRLCADLEVRSIADVTSAQVYRGTAGAAGEPVARLERPHDDDSFDCKPIGAALAEEIETNPSAFYVSVATSEFPEGAIRGQLAPG